MATIKLWALGAVAALALSLSSACMADTLAATASFSGTTVAFIAKRAYSNGTLTVVGPSGFAASVSSKGGLPSLDLAEVSLPDGQYTYQLDAATSQVDTSVVMQNNGRAKKNDVRPRKSDSLSGTFFVRGGSIVAAPLRAAGSRSGRNQDQD